jgi:hypothetical protein
MTFFSSFLPNKAGQAKLLGTGPGPLGEMKQSGNPCPYVIEHPKATILDIS